MFGRCTFRVAAYGGQLSHTHPQTHIHKSTHEIIKNKKGALRYTDAQNNQTLTHAHRQARANTRKRTDNQDRPKQTYTKADIKSNTRTHASFHAHTYFTRPIKRTCAYAQIHT